MSDKIHYVNMGYITQDMSEQNTPRPHGVFINHILCICPYVLAVKSKGMIYKHSNRRFCNG